MNLPYHLNTLIIAAHPDDEVLGCGGTIARLVEEGNQVHILILAEGLTSRDPIRDRGKNETELSKLAQIARESATILGVDSIELLDYPDNRMDSVDRLDVTKSIEQFIEKIKPSVLYTHFPGDLNIDHRVVADSVITACRPYPGQSVREIYFFEVNSSTDWQIAENGGKFFPNAFMQLSPKQFEKKMRALEVYRSEMRDFPHSRSLEAMGALGKLRGSSCGCEYAEGFMVGRVVR